MGKRAKGPRVTRRARRRGGAFLWEALPSHRRDGRWSERHGGARAHDKAALAGVQDPCGPGVMVRSSMRRRKRHGGRSSRLSPYDAAAPAQHHLDRGRGGDRGRAPGAHPPAARWCPGLLARGHPPTDPVSPSLLPGPPRPLSPAPDRKRLPSAGALPEPSSATSTLTSANFAWPAAFHSERMMNLSPPVSTAGCPSQADQECRGPRPRSRVDAR